jgi:hypothetical protein
MAPTGKYAAMFKISLREMFLLVTIAALGVGWWVDRTRLVADSTIYKKRHLAFRELGFDVGQMLHMPELTARLDADYEAKHRKWSCNVSGGG